MKKGEPFTVQPKYVLIIPVGQHLQPQAKDPDPHFICTLWTCFNHRCQHHKLGKKRSNFCDVDWKSICFLLGLVLLSVAVYYRPSSLKKNLPDKLLKAQEERRVWKEELEKSYPFVVGEVQRVTWDYNDPHFADNIVAAQKPVILTGSPSKRWKAMKEWRPSYLIEHIPVLKRTQAHENRTFSYFKETKPLSQLPAIRQRYKAAAFTNTDMNSEKFFKHASQYPPKGLFYYAVVSLDELGDLRNDLYPIEPFVVLPPTVKSELSIDKVTSENSANHRLTTLWFGPSGATTQAHYDVHNNFYVQLYGRKRFILFPPEQHQNLYLNAFLHSGAQQAQVNLDQPDYEKYPLFQNAAGLDALLQPGDVLYLPAMWFHHVIALDLSFSVSVWSQSEEILSMWKTEKVVPPIKASWSPLKKAKAAYSYMEHLIPSSMADVKKNPEFEFARHHSTFLKFIWNQRFKYLAADIPSLGRNALTDPDMYCDLLVQPEDPADELTDQELEEIYESANQVAGLMLKVKSAHERGIWLGNFCEHLALGATQLEHLVPFMESIVQCQNDM